VVYGVTLSSFVHGGNEMKNMLVCYLSMIVDSIENDYENSIKYINLFESLGTEKYLQTEGTLQEFSDFCRDRIKSASSAYSIIYLYSILIKISKEGQDLADFIDWLMESDISATEKYFCYRMISSVLFNANGKISASVFFVKYNTLLDQIVEEFAKELDSELLTEIPASERNNNFVIVITSQFIGLLHGPSKHAIDHSASLIREMGKNVLLINTAEIGAGAKTIPFYEAFCANYINEYSNASTLNWGEISIPFFQCNNDMPDINEIAVILQTIRDTRPGFIIEIGTGSVVAGLADRIVPVLTNGTMHSMIESSSTRYQTIARPVTEEERQMLEAIGRSEDNVIQSMFTSVVNKRTEEMTKTKLGIPETAFAVASVGGRLNAELTDEIIEKMIEAIDRNNSIYYVFFGGINDFEKKFVNYSDYLPHFINYGRTDNVIGCLEACDLYYNPHRIGGGMSAIEAMAVGIPAVSTAYGDGGVVLGENFWIEDTTLLADTIVMYTEDKEYYDSKAKTAKERGLYLQDSDKVFCDTVRKFLEKIEK